jgi:NADH-quinone oxidoreductase subunit D
MEEVGVIPTDMALSWGCTGPMLRASGVAWDIRKEEPYELYDEVEFNVPYSDKGDNFARYRIYMGDERICKNSLPNNRYVQRVCKKW